jgi:hypothetical protein
MLLSKHEFVGDWEMLAALVKLRVRTREGVY